MVICVIGAVKLKAMMASGSSGCGLGGQNAVTIPSSEQLLCALQANNLNWLSFVEETKMMYRQLVEGFIGIGFTEILDSNIVRQDEKTLIEQSKNALHTTRQHSRARDEIVSDSESDNPDDWEQSYSYVVPKIKENCRHKGTFVQPRLYINGRGKGLISS